MSLACDMIIKNGLVFDGSGELPIIKDIAVANGKIVAQGEDLDVGKAKTTCLLYTSPSPRD